MRHMKSLGFSALVTVTAVLSSAAEPQIEIPDAEFDFGRVCQHASVAHTFWIKSVGDDTLRITKVIPGCGCTKAPLEDSVLAPGDSTSLEIIFSTRSYRGYVSKRPYVETNIGEEKYYVKILSELLPEPDTIMPVSLSPALLDVSQFSPNPRRRAKFLILNKGEQDLDLTLIEWAKDFFDVKFPDEVKAGETVQGIVTVREDKIETEFEKSLTFQISDSTNTRYTLPVKRWYRVKQSSP